MFEMVGMVIFLRTIKDKILRRELAGPTLGSKDSVLPVHLWMGFVSMMHNY